MTKKLTSDEQDALLTIFQILYGTDEIFQKYKHSFNEKTLEVAEDALQQLQRCNNQLYDLISGLLGVRAVMAKKGWLRDILKEVATALADEKNRYDLAGCRNAVAIMYRSKIITSTF